MEYTAKQQASLRAQFAAKRRKQIMVAIPLIAMMILLVLSGENADKVVLGMSVEAWGPAFVILILGGIGFSLYNWRCPACNKYLGKAISPKFCSKCGVALS